LSFRFLTRMQEARRAAPFTLGHEHQGAQTQHEAGFRRDVGTPLHTTAKTPGRHRQYVWRRAISRSIIRSMTMYFSIRRRSSFASGV
jgi:hypothetical protein